jgi:hypothetical protein
MGWVIFNTTSKPDTCTFLARQKMLIYVQFLEQVMYYVTYALYGTLKWDLESTDMVVWDIEMAPGVH